MARSTFTHEFRLLVCANCGASLTVPEHGGLIACRYCAAQTEFRPRAEVSDIARLRSAPAADEYDRYQKLKAQEDRAFVPPPGLEAFVVAGELPPQLLPQAQLAWQQFVKEVRAGGPMGVHDKLFFLSVALAQTLLRHGGLDGEGRRRAVIETAIEALASPQHRYQLRSMLARDAVRHGDLVSADAWLAGCDPRSYDIHVDSDYRVAAACVATARGDFASVLHQLGQRVGDVPLAPANRWLAGFFRANALERTGRAAEALALVRQLAGPDGLDDFLVVQKLYASLHLCAGTLPMLVAERQAEAARGTAPQGRAGGGWMTSPVAIPFALIGVAMAVGGFFVDPKARTDDNVAPLNVFLWLMGGGMFSAAVLSGFLSRALSSGFSALTASHDTTGWTRAAARVVSVQPTGWTINDLPQLALRLEVFVGTSPAYLVDTKLCVPPHQVAELQPGASLSVNVHPTDPGKVSAG